MAAYHYHNLIVTALSMLRFLPIKILFYFVYICMHAGPSF
jgi:hypothetical protein